MSKIQTFVAFVAILSAVVMADFMPAVAETAATRASGDVRWGDPVGGLRMGMHCLTSPEGLRTAAELRVELVIQNVSSNDIKIVTGPRRAAFRLTVTRGGRDADVTAYQRQLIEDEAKSAGEAGIAGIVLRPGEMIRYGFNLSQYYDVSFGGAYVVNAHKSLSETATLKSAPMTLTLMGSEETMTCGG